MTRNAIEGARYRDDLYDDEFVIESIDPDKDSVNDPSEIELTLVYDGQIGEITVTLEQFRNERTIYVSKIPHDE